VSEEAFGDGVKMVGVALIVAIGAVVGIVEEPDGAYLVANCDDWLAWKLDDLHDLVVSAVLGSDVLQRRVWSKAFTEPLEIKVNSFSVDDSAAFNFKKLHLSEIVFALQIVIICWKIYILDAGFEAIESAQLRKALFSLVQTDLGCGRWGRGNAQ